MTIDAFTYNGEADILEIRLNILDERVDQFVIVEAPLTFSGHRKPMYFEQQKERFAKWLPKIKYFVVDEDDEELWEMARSSPNTVGAEHWKREFVQKESIKKALTHLNDDDIVFIGDVDEIWEFPIQFLNVLELVDRSLKIKLKVYTYYLNNRSSEEFWGTIVSRYGFIKNKCLNHLRSNDSVLTDYYAGWHFTSMGGYDELRRKLDDSYTRESYWTMGTELNLKERHSSNKDFLGRNFTYSVDESELPEYIIKNRERWEKLFR